MNLLRCYALALCVLGYMASLVGLNAAGLFPRVGLYDLSRLVGGSLVTLEGRVRGVPTTRWNQTRFLFEACAQPLQAFCGRTVVTLRFPDEALAPDDRLRVRGWLSAPRAPSRARRFDEQGYWASQGTFSMLRVWNEDGRINLGRPRWSLARAGLAFHRRFRRFWESRLPPTEAALLLGITIGARGSLPRDVKEQCIRAGVYHIVVVSGQNVAVVLMLGIWTISLCRVPRRRAFWVCLAPILFYTAAVGGDPPVVRATAMTLAGLFGAALGRDGPRFYPLFIAAGWILMGDPESLFGASFRLSFGATVSLLVVLPSRIRAASWREWIVSWLKCTGVASLAIHLGVWPLLVVYFHRISLAGLLANWTILPLADLMMIVGLAIGSWGLAAPVPDFLIKGVEGLIQLTLAAIETASRWPWAVVNVAPPRPGVFLVYYATLFGILFAVKARHVHAQQKISHPPSRRTGL